jgi:hypothetical protein
MTLRRVVATTAIAMAVVAVAMAQSPPPQQPPPAQPPVPRPFPGTTQPAATHAAPPAPPAAAPATPDQQAANPVPPGTPADVMRVPIFPAAEYLDSFDAGRGQRYYLFGVNSPYATIVAYYRKAIGNGGRELFRTPAMQQFDLGRFQEETMAYPPSVVVKDYAWGELPGFLFVKGTTEKRYQTIIQIVPPAGPVK